MTSERATAPEQWVRPRIGRAELRADLALALVLALSAALTSLLYHRAQLYDEPAGPALWVITLAAATLPLALRRRYPIPVLIVISAAFFVCGQFQVPETLIVNIAMFIAFYTVGAWEPNRTLAVWVRLAIGLGMIVWLVLTIVLAAADTDAFPGFSRSGLFSAFATFAILQIITNLLYFSGAWFFGDRTWHAARAQTQLQAQGHELELERQTSAAQAVALDRLNIARELHDVVAHHVSVMGIQAAAARRSLARDPERAVAALETVEESAHEAVTELRRLVHTLREPDAEDGATTVGISQLGGLVAQAQEAGLPTTLIVAGTPRPLPMLVDIALYRVAQEALTNTRKHAGRGAEATVRLRFEPAAVEVEVSDTGVRTTLAQAPTGAGTRVGARPQGGAAPDTLAAGEHSATVRSATAHPAGTHSAGASGGSGLGLRGMRERIGAVGGSVTAGRRDPEAAAHGFIVRARVPLAEHKSAQSEDRA